MSDASVRAARLVEGLADAGDLASEWRPAFLAVPRHRFVPDTVWREDGGRLVPVHRGDGEGAWLDVCYANEAVITQVDDGRPAGPGLVGDEITSSSSRPDVVALMLAALDVEPGMSVLEIGTGTGWNAALLAERIGGRNVTSVEVDPAVAGRARAALSGYGVAVVVGDGALGHPAGTPYDRVISTVAVRDVPWAWAEQTRPGGRVLVPWATDFHNGALVSFVVAGDGSMSGRIVGNVAFMLLREQRGRHVSLARDVRNAGQARRSVTGVHPYDVIGEYDASLAVGLRVPHCKLVVEQQEDGAYTVWLVDPWSGSWASLGYEPGADVFPVREYGGRGLWTEVEAAHRWWDGLGRPRAERWGITVDQAGQRVWLDSQDWPVHP